MYSLRRRLSQNFLHSRKLVTKLLDSSSIGKNDLVLEIGPGKGIITEQLIQKVQHVVAVEIDFNWFKYLKDKFRNTKNLTLCQNNILNFELPSSPYKVFANIPFSIEGKLIRKLIDAKNPPEDCYLVMREEFAYRLSGVHRENQFSLIHKPWFSLSIYYQFHGKDFIPHTKVNIAMIRFRKLSEPLLPLLEKSKYQNFIKLGFGNGLPVFKNLKKVWGVNKTVNAFKKAQVGEEMKPSYLSLQQWLKLYANFKG